MYWMNGILEKLAGNMMRYLQWYYMYNTIQINWVLGVEWGRPIEEIHAIRLCGIQLSRMLLKHK